MPKTKFQSIIFTALMVFCMVFCMTVYTISLNSGVFDFQTFSLAIREMWLEYIVVFCLIFFLITNTSKKLAFRIIQPNCLPPIFTILSIQCFTVLQFTMPSGLHSVLERPFSEANGRPFLVKRSPLIVC